ncbi:MAG: GDP-L-fucose synthase [Micrococcales bacterium]|nr:GDP-L-fucose synthase [Micrococcales bacterium]
MLVDKTATTFVAGHRGLAGSAIWRRLETEGWTDLVGRTQDRLDLLDKPAVDAFFDEVRPQTVVIAAAKVAGIGANDAHPAEFISENLRIQLNLMDAAARTRTPRLLFIGSAVVYPETAPQPITEDRLLTGPLEPANTAYGMAKIAGIAHLQAVRREHGLAWVSAMPTNLYGPGANFAPGRSHVVPSMVRRYVEAVEDGMTTVTHWGSGRPRRDVLHIDDLASAVAHLLERYDDDSPVNVGTGTDHTIAEMADLVAQAAGYTGQTGWDTSHPDGTARRLLDITRLTATGWQPKIGLDEGLTSTVAWYRQHRSQARA